MDFVDKILKCADCGTDFVFTAGEQLFFFDKQFKNDPKRCKQCKAKRASGSGSARPETRTVCSECGTETTVPFKPTQGRPVLCRSCFQQKRTHKPGQLAPNRSPGSAPFGSRIVQRLFRRESCAAPAMGAPICPLTAVPER